MSHDTFLNLNLHRTKECLPYLKKSPHAHILNISPPLNMNAHWFGKNVAYTMAKYGMSMCVLGMADEFKAYGIGVNALWPKTIISTAALSMVGGDTLPMYARKPEIMADAAYCVLSQDPKLSTGNFFIDEDVLIVCGRVTDFRSYACVPENADQLLPDGFIDYD